MIVVVIVVVDRCRRVVVQVVLPSYQATQWHQKSENVHNNSITACTYICMDLVTINNKEIWREELQKILHQYYLI